MQKWEYKTLFRKRGWEETPATWLGQTYFVALPWPEDFHPTVQQLGDDGWELVAISPRTSVFGHATTRAASAFGGFIDEESWVFKRPKP